MRKLFFNQIKGRVGNNCTPKMKPVFVSFVLDKVTDQCKIVATDENGITVEKIKSITENSEMADLLFSRVSKLVLDIKDLHIVNWELDYDKKTERTEVFYLSQDGTKKVFDVTDPF